jgi:hypothetical protein
MQIVLYTILFILLSPGLLFNSIGIKTKITPYVVMCHAVIYSIIYYIIRSYNEGYANMKQYNTKHHNKVIISTHTGLGDIINHIGALSYLSSIYDEVVLCLTTNQTKKVSDFFSHLPNVKFHEYSFDSTTHNIYYLVEKVGEELKQFESTHDIRTAGYFNAIQSKPASETDLVPFNFYDDLDIDPTYFYKYAHINKVPGSETLYSIVAHIPYILISPDTFSGETFSVEFVEKHFNISRDTILILCTNKNIYPEGHKYYLYANNFVMKPFLDYVDTIIHASKVIVSDSSMLCLSIHIPIITNECYYVARNNKDTSYIWNPKYGYDTSSNKKVFKQLTV